MNRKLNVGAVGIGGIWHGAHVEGWDALSDVKLLGVCDIVESKARNFAAKREIEHVFADYRELLKVKEIDAIDVCTSNRFHSEISVAALEAGKDVFCEKPDAINPAEAQRMADAAKASGRTLMTMRNNRFTPGSVFLKRYADAGSFGDIYTGRCGWIRRRGIPGRGGWFTTKALSGGGPLIDLGVHMIDLATWLMGNPKPVAVVGSIYNKFASAEEISDSAHSAFGEAKKGGTFDVEDLATGFIKFENGASLQIEFSWASNVEEERNFVELRGSKGGCNYVNGDVKLFTEMNGTLCDIHPRLARQKGSSHMAAIAHFADVVLRGATPTIVPADGVHMIKILDAIYESARTGREVRL